MNVCLMFHISVLTYGIYLSASLSCIYYYVFCLELKFGSLKMSYGSKVFKRCLFWDGFDFDYIAVLFQEESIFLLWYFNTREEERWVLSWLRFERFRDFIC